MILKNARMRRAIVILALLCLPGVAIAGGAGDGFVSYVYVTQAGKVLFAHSGARTAVPACALAPQNFSFNATTPAGQALLSHLLSAYAQHRQVRINGTGACSDGYDAESIDWILAIG